MAVRMTAQSKIVLIGDSITDAGRFEDPEHLGSGYVRLIRDYLYARDPAAAGCVVNQGISGHKVTDLADRWDKDVIQEKPDILSVYVGINDVWHGIASWGTGGVSIDRYTTVYKQLISLTRDRLPNCQLVLCQPSVIWPPAPDNGNELLKPYVQAVAALAKPFGAVLVPLHDAFEKARAARPDIVWAPDGVHPSSAGHMLIARTWLAATGLL